jgi:hypothetical protein
MPSRFVIWIENTRSGVSGRSNTRIRVEDFVRQDIGQHLRRDDVGLRGTRLASTTIPDQSAKVAGMPIVPRPICSGANSVKTQQHHQRCEPWIWPL